MAVDGIPGVHSLSDDPRRTILVRRRARRARSVAERVESWPQRSREVHRIRVQIQSAACVVGWGPDGRRMLYREDSYMGHFNEPAV